MRFLFLCSTRREIPYLRAPMYYSFLLTSRARAELGIIGPRSFLYVRNATTSGPYSPIFPHARSIRSYYVPQ